MGRLQSEVVPRLYQYPEELWEVLEEAHSQGLRLQSNFAREYSRHVATAASLGWITNILPATRTSAPVWLLTPAGTFALFNKGHFIHHASPERS